MPGLFSGFFSKIKNTGYSTSSWSAFVSILFAIYVLMEDTVLPYLYNSLFSKEVYKAASGVVFRQETSYILGIVLFAAMLMELIAVIIKGRFYPRRISTGFLILIWIFHAVVSMVILMTGMTALGFDVSGEQAPIAFAMFAVVIKEIIILCIIIAGPGKKDAGTSLKISSDLFLLFFYCTGYTTVWMTLMTTENPANYLLSGAHSAFLLVMNVILAVLLFCIFYLPLRLGYFITQGSSVKAQAVTVISIILTALFSIMPLFEGYTSVESALKNRGDSVILFINNRGIKNISSDIVNLENLKILWADSNELYELPAGFESLKRIEKISLGNNRFSLFPPALCDIVTIEYLDMSMNQLYKLPAETGRLKNLKYLNLRYNQLRDLPEEFENLQKLDTLEISHNNFTAIPDAVLRLANLRILKIEGNKIAVIPDELGNLKHLKEIYAERCGWGTKERERIKSLLPSVTIKE